MYMTNSQRKEYFAEELKKMLDRNGTTLAALAKDVDVKYSRLHHWATARSMPSIHIVQQICDFLGDEEIMKAALLANTRKCSNCGKDYIQESSQGKSFLCSSECRSQNRRLRDKTGKSAVKSTEYIAENIYEKAIDAYCNGCQPAGICLTPECELRPVSPLPLFSASEAKNGSGANWSADRVELQRKHIATLQPKLIAARKSNREKVLADKSK